MGVLLLMRSTLVVLALVFAMTPVAFAQEEERLSMTLTPPLFQVTQAPGGEWSSTLRVVNPNPFDLVVTATVHDFRPDGESGNALMSDAPVSSPDDTRLMSGWIIVPKEDIVIKKGTTGVIPFTIRVPEHADPGGHYAAIIVGTRSMGEFSGSGAGVSSAISSLFFLRVPGEVVEDGAIRDFYAEKGFLQSPEATFALRFENKGNVHLVPEGSIIITNMWGKERGKIDINSQSTFGNVLPASTRKFEFAWKGEENLFEFGRYKALATLVYGEEGRQSVHRVAYFWIIPWKHILPVLGGFILFVWFMIFSLRRYVRKALLLERARLGLPPISGTPSLRTPSASSTSPVRPTVTLAVLRRPLLEPDLHEAESKRAHRTGKGTPSRKRHSPFRNPSVIGFLVVFVIGITLIGWYFVEVFQSERSYQMQQIKDR